MDSFTHSFLHSLAEALARLRADAGAEVSLCASDSASTERARAGISTERARAGMLTALAHLPPSHTHTAYPDDDRTVTDLGGGWYVVAAPLCTPGRAGLDGSARGVARLALPQEPDAALIASVEALAAHAALALEQGALHQELQHSFNQLFIVYEAGRLLNLCHTADDVYAHVIDLLTRTLHFSHCAVLLLQGDNLTPAAHQGLDPRWAAHGRLPLQRSFAARVLEEGAAAQFDEGASLRELALPPLAGGGAPASVLCAPLTTRAGAFGFLEVYGEVARPFTDDETFVVSVLAVETAAALENARLYEALREREERLTQYAGKLVNSQEEERRRISRDIHDGLGQMIVSAYQYLQAHDYSLPEGHPRETFARGLSVLQQCIGETRRVMSDLRPSTLDDFGLVVALQQQLDAVARDAGWHATFEVEGPVARLIPAVETTVFRVVQEALNNARKHAAATRVAVTLAAHTDEVVVVVRDWGRGFAVDDVTVRPERGEHLGVMGMRERVALLGGDVTITSAPGEGTTVRITLPVVSRES